MYQAIHRNRGIQKNRIIFAYCWIPETLLPVRDENNKVILDRENKINEEFDVRKIEFKEEDEFFDALRLQVGNRNLINKVLDEISLTSKSDTKIAKELSIYKKGLWEKPDGTSSYASKYIKVVREGIYQREKYDERKKQKIKEKFSIWSFIKK